VSEVWGSEINLYYPELYAGTTDLIGVYRGEPAIMDFKQSRKLKKAEWVEDYYLQLVAYAEAHNKLFNTQIRHGSIFICTQNNEYQTFEIDNYDLNNPKSFPKGFVNKKLLDATTERLIKLHQYQDDVEAMKDAAKYARLVRERIGLSQQEFSNRIEVSLETIRNWEQGKRSPTGAAKALLKILYRAPEVALLALSV
jgi:putative transcriptional regulator